mmetsp:Transcript_24863/g.80417  ORF Transcript_24863/g.80417 Transcript_24863/m.80417 type:complete len:523 (-) Transcript_24863:106-1674(-)
MAVLVLVVRHSLAGQPSRRSSVEEVAGGEGEGLRRDLPVLAAARVADDLDEVELLALTLVVEEVLPPLGDVVARRSVEEIEELGHLRANAVEDCHEEANDAIGAQEAHRDVARVGDEIPAEARRRRVFFRGRRRRRLQGEGLGELRCGVAGDEEVSVAILERGAVPLGPAAVVVEEGSFPYHDDGAEEPQVVQIPRVAARGAAREVEEVAEVGELFMVYEGASYAAALVAGGSLFVRIDLERGVALAVASQATFGGSDVEEPGIPQRQRRRGQSREVAGVAIARAVRVTSNSSPPENSRIALRPVLSLPQGQKVLEVVPPLLVGVFEIGVRDHHAARGVVGLLRDHQKRQRLVAVVAAVRGPFVRVDADARADVLRAMVVVAEALGIRQGRVHRLQVHLVLHRAKKVSVDVEGSVDDPHRVPPFLQRHQQRLLCPRRSVKRQRLAHRRVHAMQRLRPIIRRIRRSIASLVEHLPQQRVGRLLPSVGGHVEEEESHRDDLLLQHFFFCRRDAPEFDLLLQPLC